MQREAKEKQIELYTKILQMPGVYLTDFTGIDVPKMGELRKKMRDESVRFLVVKNTLARRAAEKAGLTQLNDYLVRPTALAYSEEDAVNPARVIAEFHKKTGKLEVKCGIIEGELYNADQITGEIARLPSRTVLQTRIAMALNSNLVGLASALNNILTGFARVLNAVKEQRMESSSGDSTG